MVQVLMVTVPAPPGIAFAIAKYFVIWIDMGQSLIHTFSKIPKVVQIISRKNKNTADTFDDPFPNQLDQLQLYKERGLVLLLQDIWLTNLQNGNINVKPKHIPVLLLIFLLSQNQGAG